MTTPLRQDIQKLAYEVPALRGHLVPLLRKAARAKGDPNVALASIRIKAERDFLENVVMTVIRYSAKGTPVQGKPGGHTEQRGVVTGFIMNREGPQERGLMIQAKVKKDKIIVVLSDLDEKSKRKFVFSENDTPASIAADLMQYGQEYIIA